MAVDLEALRKRLSQLNGTAKGGSDTWWKPKVGEYTVRIVPWRDGDKSVPFREVWYYNGIGKPDAKGRGPFPMQTLHQYKKPDPIQELINSLRQEDKDRESEDNKPLLKKLYPKLTTMVPIIVRGEEDKGVRLWPIKMQELYQKLMGYFFDPGVLEDTEDYTNPRAGFDIKVSVTDSGKRYNGNIVTNQSIELARKVSPLSKDDAQIEKWLNGIPDFNEVDPVLSYDDMKARLESWLAEGAPGKGEMNSSAGESERGGNSTTDLDALQKDLSTEKQKPQAKVEETPAETSKPAASKPKAGKKGAAEAQNALDEMFKELE